MLLNDVNDDEKIWAGARVRLYNVGMNLVAKENDYYEYIVSYIYDNNKYLQLTNLTTGKGGNIICVIEKEFPNHYALGKTLKYMMGLENTYFKTEFAEYE
ncbi:hypothetical protein WAK64_06130 [Bacillus spongiae]|uniref:DUF1642 domain-containing protein n=1 Tax=Bacillus spongiae TaxID=2683610 RepID=A0ABU8HBD5_9BACI